MKIKNGETVSGDRPLDKSRLKPGDRTTLEFKSKTYHGVVDVGSIDSPHAKAGPDTTPSGKPESLDQEGDSELPISPCGKKPTNSAKHRKHCLNCRKWKKDWLPRNQVKLHVFIMRGWVA